LYLHSSLVQTRRHDDLGEAVRSNTLDTLLALGSAFFVNAGILILAAAVFHPRGIVVEELQQAHQLLTPLLGGSAATLFALALLCSGQSSTITGTLAGQIVMEGFLSIKVAPWMRRLITRGLAMIPALWAISATGGSHTVELLVISQVILSLQLPFAIFPLVQFTSDPKLMGPWANPMGVKWAAYGLAAAISALNFYLLWTTLGPAWSSPIFVLALILGIYLARKGRAPHLA